MQKTAQVVDARPANRFRGEAPEPRPGVRPGHMPGALNVPVTELVQDGRLIAPEKIAQTFAAGGVDLNKPVITSCGSGVTAATLWFALEAIGKAPKRSTTARGRNGARGPICRCRQRLRSLDPIALRVLPRSV